MGAGSDRVRALRVTTRQSKPQRLAEVLLGQIHDGTLAAGTRLPSERQLAADYHVGRNAIREALAVLQLSGYIETRLGDGHYVSIHRPGVGPVDPSLIASLNITESLHMREALEISAAALAIRKATRSDLLKLDAVLAELEEHVETGDYESYLLATLDLHKLIAAASHNQPLIDLIDEITDRHGCDQWLVHDRYTDEIATYSLGLHTTIVSAIRGKDIVAAIDAIFHHYERYPVLQGSGSASGGC